MDQELIGVYSEPMTSYTRGGLAQQSLFVNWRHGLRQSTFRNIRGKFHHDPMLKKRFFEERPGPQTRTTR